MKDKKIALPRFCKYIHCKKLLPKDAPTLKKYCKGTECAYKMNQLEAAERRAEDKINNPKPKKFRVCSFDECKKPFEVPPKSPLQAYCNDDCRSARHKKAQNIKNKQRAARKIFKMEKEEKLFIAETKKKKSGIKQRFLVRGLDENSSNQIACMLSVNA